MPVKYFQLEEDVRQKNIFTMIELTELVQGYRSEKERMLAFVGDTWRPPLFELKDYDIFFAIYNSIEELVNKFSYENYFNEQLIAYIQLKDDPKLLQKWAERNEKLGTEDFVCFEVDYLDYCEAPSHLKLHISLDETIDIRIDKNEFKNTLAFLEVFNELYDVQKILPEGITRIEEEMKALSKRMN